MTSRSGTSTVPPFKFRHRGETVDWRQMNKVDINHVKSHLDIETLQEHIKEVMLCSLDGERCQECRSPVDPGLLKVLQLAQLSMEWLLHCQEVLSLNLHAVEERLEVMRKEQEQLLEQQSQQEERVKALEEELVLKGKLVSDLQSKLLLCNHKCPICKKGFFTPQFLQSHMERRHPEDHESQLQSDREIKSQINNLKMEISSLRERNVQLQQNLDLKTAQEKRLESELGHFKAEEMARFERVQTDSARSQEQLLLKLEQQLKEQEHGSGAADASQADGHQSKLTARMAAQTQTQSKTQSFKRKPGHADNERSTGDYNEQINKRLRTVESSKDRSTDNRPSDAQQDSELYEHIKQGETAYDTQTYDVASADQQKAAGPQQDQDQKDEDVAMETEDQEEDLRAADVQELKPEQLDSTKASQKGASISSSTASARGGLGQKFSPGIVCPDQPTTLSADTT